MLVLEEMQLLFVQQEASQHARVNSCLDQVSDVQLLLDVCLGFTLQAQLSVTRAYRCAAKGALEPRHFLV